MARRVGLDGHAFLVAFQMRKLRLADKAIEVFLAATYRPAGGRAL